MRKPQLLLLLVIITALGTPLFLPCLSRAKDIIDNLDGTAYGDWGLSSWAAGYYGANYHYHSAGAGTDTFTWTPTVTNAGTYEVFARWTTSGQEPDTTRAVDATYTVYHNGGNTPVSVDQQYDGGQWVSLGIYSFDGVGVEQVVLADSASGIVIADAVMWELE